MPFNPENNVGMRILDRATFSEIRRLLDMGYCQTEVIEEFKKRTPKGKRNKVGLTAVATAYPFDDYEAYKNALEQKNKTILNKRVIRKNKESDVKEATAEKDDFKFILNEVLQAQEKTNTLLEAQNLVLGQIKYNLGLLVKQSTQLPVIRPVPTTYETKEDKPVNFPKAPFLSTPVTSKVSSVDKTTEKAHTIK